MHILGGLLLLAVAFMAIFFISSSGVFEPILGSLGINTSSSTLSNESAYAGEVEIAFVSLGSPDQPMLVSLKGVMTENPDGLFVSDWSLRTNVNTYGIPRATNLYSPSVEGVPPEAIYLRPGGTVNLYSGTNPAPGQPQALRSGLNEWHVYLGQDLLTSPHGTIILRDANAKEVDRYEY